MDEIHYEFIILKFICTCRKSTYLFINANPLMPRHVSASIKNYS